MISFFFQTIAVNETRVVYFFKPLEPELYLNGNSIGEVGHNKYLGSILRSVPRSNQHTMSLFKLVDQHSTRI